jgi:hypothetical protein
MADEGKDPLKQYENIPGEKGQINVRLSPKPKPDEAQASQGQQDKTGGYLPPTDEEEDLIPSDEQSIQVFDLATRFEAHGVNEYTNLNYVAGMARTDEVDPFTFLHLHPDDDDLEALDRAMLAKLAPDPIDAYDPLGKLPTVEGHGKTTSSVLLINHKSDIGEDGGIDLQGLVLRAEDGTSISVQLESEWKWRGTNLDTKNWASSNTEFHVAPALGRFVRKGRKRKYISIAWDDYRYHLTDTADAQWKVTERASFDSPSVSLKIEFPLRVFVAPSLWSATEASGGAAMIGLGSPLSAVALVTINEYGVNAGVRVPAIPGPFSNFQDEYDTDPERYLLVKRELTYFWPGQVRTEEVTYISGRRCLPNEVLWAEAFDYGKAHYVRAEHDGLDWFPLSFLSPGFPYSFNARHAQREGHLTGIITCRKKVYYIWRA